jgi:AcrR family transcriptional regulator
MRIVKSAGLRRQELLDIALKLFATRGYDETSVNDVIEAAGLSKGAFYHHFSSKEDLMKALAIRYAEDAAARARGVLEDRSLDCFERLSRFLSRMRDTKAAATPETYAAFAPLFNHENIDLYERTRLAVNEVVRPMLVGIIREGVAEQTFDTPDPEGAADVILHLMGVTRPTVAELYAARSRPEIDRISRRLLQQMTYIGTVVDRILGIPEGSIGLADCHTIDEVARVWHASAVA